MNRVTRPIDELRGTLSPAESNLAARIARHTGILEHQLALPFERRVRQAGNVRAWSQKPRGGR